ncbi:MAG: hypothetical protein RL189_331 [Pseudomonadota bacterium]
MKFKYKAAFAALSLYSVAGCGWLASKQPAGSLADDVNGLEPQTKSGQTTLPDTQLPALPRGANRLDLTPETHLPVRYASGGKAMIPVEGLLSDAGFARVQANGALQNLPAAEKTRQTEKLLRNIVARISSRAELSNLYYAPDVGYFSGWIAVSDYSRLSGIGGLEADIVLAPRVQANAKPDSYRRERSSVRESATGKSAEQLSGIERMGVSQFLREAAAELGQTPTGERVRVGVTDTGITYAHPAFRSSQAQRRRITYMKDSTNEGAGFVSQRALIKVARDESTDSVNSKGAVSVLIDAEYLSPEVFADGSLSTGENGELLLPFQSISGEKFVLSKRLHSELSESGTAARLGLISETSFASEDEQVDINGNGKNDDKFYFFIIPSGRGEKVYIDFSGTKDFRAVKAMGDFNKTSETADVLSEKIGLSISEIEVPPADPSAPSEKLVRVALVGFDPGNHGSHVAGIIGAQRMVSNDAADTQARGVAPESELMINRVCSNNSGCNATKAIIDLARSGAEIINMSLGGLSSANDGYGVQETIINRLTELYDVLFVISAGNSGPGRQTVGSPSTARHALSVAATATQGMIAKQYQWQASRSASSAASAQDEDFVMYFSSRGPTAAGGFKPNIAAPGTQLSTIQLNSASGSRAGLDVYWGTSMAAPAAAGAIALLVDAAKIYNAKNPQRPLPTDALTIRRIILDSARPFQVNSFNPLTGASSKGVYTWIDQGYGMVSLPRAWELLKKKAAIEIPSGVELTGEGSIGKSRSASLDYKVRVLRSLGNGMRYDGTQTFDTGALVGSPQTERKFGQGIWLTEQEAENLVEVHFNRNLNLKDLGSSNVGDLLRQLNTSAESFALETTYYGSRSAWLKVGVPQAVSCNDESIGESPSLTIYGSGAVDLPAGARTGLNPSRASALYLCLRKSLLADLPAGDHGAIIRAYKVVNGQRDVTAAFEIPVYLTMPHHSASMQAKFSLSKQIGSFMVDRHYVRVPKGVSVLRVALEVPKANAADNGRSCSAVSLSVLAGGNTRTPADLAMLGSVAQSCSSLGAPINNRLVTGFTEMNPMAGIWDLHVFGRFQFPLSSYSLNIDYATFAEIADLDLLPSTLASGEFPVELKESTFDATPSAEQSQFLLNGLLGKTQHEITPSSGLMIIPSAAGKVARTYAEGTGRVTVTTTSSMQGLDIDMVIDECDDEALKICKAVARSGSATADERGAFAPQTGKFYAVRIDPYDVPADKAGFISTELIQNAKPEAGQLRVSRDASAENRFTVGYGFDATASRLLADPLFTGGQYGIAGEIKLLNADGIGLTNVDVKVSRQ